MIEIMTAEILRSEETIRNSLHSPLRYGRAIQGDCDVSFVDGHIMNIVEDMTTSNFLECEVYSHLKTIG